MPIVWEYLETYNHDEPIMCLCGNHLATGEQAREDVIEQVTCGKCGQELRIQNKTYQVHEVYAKKEVGNGKDRNDEVSTKETKG